MNEEHNWDEILIDLLSEYEEREIEKIQLEQKDTKISPALDSSIRSLIQQRKKRKKTLGTKPFSQSCIHLACICVHWCIGILCDTKV